MFCIKSTISLSEKIIPELMVESCVGLKCQGSVVQSIAFKVVGNRTFSWMWNSSISDNVRPYGVMNYGIASGYHLKANAEIASYSTFWHRPALEFVFFLCSL